MQRKFKDLNLDQSSVERKISNTNSAAPAFQQCKDSKRGINRTQPICWYSATLQLFNVVDWPASFNNYAATSQDAFAVTFRMIVELNARKTKAISAQISCKAAQNFIKYVNSEKQKAPPSPHIGQDPLWTIHFEQDAQESMIYFLNMITDIAKPVKPTNAVKSKRKDEQRIREMQNFIAHQFVTITKETIQCKQVNQSHVTREEPHYMFTVGVPDQKEEVQLQDLVDVVFANEPIQDVQCEHCKSRHTCFKKLEMKILTNQFLLLHLARFIYDDTVQHAHKIETPVDFSKPIVLKCDGTYFAFKVVAAINHNGLTVQHGHYTVDKYVSNVLHNFNDGYIRQQQNFNHEEGYVLLLQKMQFSEGSSLISRYLSNLEKHEVTVKNLQKKLNITQPSEATSTSTVTSHLKAAQDSGAFSIASSKPCLKQPTEYIKQSSPKKTTVHATENVKGLRRSARIRKRKLETSEKQIGMKASKKLKLQQDRPTKNNRSTVLRRSKRLKVQAPINLNSSDEDSDLNFTQKRQTSKIDRCSQPNSIKAQANRQRQRNFRAKQTEEQKKLMRDKDAARKKAARENQSAKKKAVERNKLANKQRQRRAKQTSAERDLQRKNAVKRKRRLEFTQTKTEKNKRRKIDAQRKRKQRETVSLKTATKNLQSLISIDQQLKFEAFCSGFSSTDLTNVQLVDLKQLLQLHSFEDAANLKAKLIELSLNMDHVVTVRDAEEVMKLLLNMKLIDCRVLQTEQWRMLTLFGIPVTKLYSNNRTDETEISNLSRTELKTCLRLSNKKVDKLVQALEAQSNKCPLLFFIKLQNASVFAKAAVNKLQKTNVMQKFKLLGENMESLLQKLQTKYEYALSGKAQRNLREEIIFFTKDDHCIQKEHKRLMKETAFSNFAHLEEKLHNFNAKTNEVSEDLFDCNFAQQAVREYSETLRDLQMTHCKICEEAVPRVLQTKELQNFQRNPVDYVCPVCSKEVTKVHKHSKENDMIPDRPEKWLNKLTTVELNLCKPVLTMYHVFRTTNSPLAQRKFKGNVICYPQDIGPIANSLPRHPSEAGILIVKAKNQKGIEKEWTVKRLRPSNITLKIQRQRYNEVKLTGHNQSTSILPAFTPSLILSCSGMVLQIQHAKTIA